MLLFYLNMIDDDHNKHKFEMIYKKYNSLIFFAVKNSTSNKNIIEDAVQETYIRIIKNLDIIRTDNSKDITALIYLMAKQCTIDCIRKENYYIKQKTFIEEESSFNYEDISVDIIYTKEVIEFIKNTDGKYFIPLKFYVLGYTFLYYLTLIPLQQEFVYIELKNLY